MPEIEIEGWWTSLDLPEEEVIHRHADHGTSVQFHSELKTNLDIERLPSGKFDTNRVTGRGQLVPTGRRPRLLLAR